MGSFTRNNAAKPAVFTTGIGITPFGASSVTPRAEAFAPAVAVLFQQPSGRRRVLLSRLRELAARRRPSISLPTMTGMAKSSRVVGQRDRRHRSENVDPGACRGSSWADLLRGRPGRRWWRRCANAAERPASAGTTCARRLRRLLTRRHCAGRGRLSDRRGQHAAR